MKYEIIDETKKIATIVIAGELNGINLPELYKTIYELIEQGIIYLILDFSDMQFISSLGIGCVVEAGQEFTNKGGSVNLVCRTPRLLEEFEIMHLDKIINIFTEFDKALDSINKVSLN